MLLAQTRVHAQVPLPGFPDSTSRADSAFRSRFPFSGLPDSSDPFKRFRTDSSQFQPDSLGALADSLHARSDTTQHDSTADHWVVYLDSTARMKEFVHQRSDMPAVEMFPRPNYSLYLDIRSPGYKRDVQLDSMGRFVIVREMVNDVDVKIPMRMSLEEYIHQRYQYEKANNWRSFASEYAIRENRDQLGGLLGSFTNISIPVPANPLLSIFGSPKINLHISGAVDIRAAFRNQSSDQAAISQLDRSRNEPDFNQDVQINVNGTIGDKLNILADWNTQRTFEYENQLKIKYTGYEDEVVQSVEAGNVSLQTPGLVGGGQALFGIKAKLQTGPLTLTTLLSQKKGQTHELTVSGGAASSEFPLYPHDYSRNHFFVDPVYRQYFEELHLSTSPVITQDILRNQIVQMDVYVSLTTAVNLENNKKTARAYIDLPAHTDTSRYTESELNNLSKLDGQYVAQAVFKRLDPTKDYTFDKYGGFINLFTSVSDNQIIAVSYSIVDGNKTYGGKIEGNDSVEVLKMVKPQYLIPSYKPAWDLMMKNIYSLHTSNLKKEGFEFRIERVNLAGANTDQIEGQPLLKIFGLDRFGADNTGQSDNAFDFIPNLTVDQEHGEIIFPTLRPFDSTIVQYFRGVNPAQPVGDSLLFSEVYDTTSQAAQNSLRNKYLMKIKAAGAQSSRYSLGFNLVENSVQVLLNGRTLTPNVDYTVDYIVGEVVIRNPEALLPNAQVQVKYEQNDLFQLASKTLIGARGEVTTFANTNIGFTIMGLNQATLSDKVRLGEEPTSNLILGVDASSSMNLPFLTSLIDDLPLLRTREMSTLRFSGEAAYMIPDPNTKKSTIASDNNLSIAYIDDFEGTRRTIPMSISYSAWTLSSPPVYSLLGPGVSDSVKTWSKAKLVWYNRLPSDVISQEIWPLRKTRTGQNQVTVLNLDYDPNHRGTYNFSPNLDSTLHRGYIGGNTGLHENEVDGYGRRKRQQNWNGITRYIGTTAGSILEQNITYLEIWAKAISDSVGDLQRGRLYVDLGRVSEAVIPNGRLMSEDNVRTQINPGGIPNGILNPGEDIGIDMLDDPGEAVLYGSFLSSNAGDPDVDPADPAGDNWVAYRDPNRTPSDPRPFPYSLDDLRRFNGTEKNALDAAGLTPNTEDLNGNNALDEANQYLEYEIPLDTVYTDSLGNPQHNALKVGGGTNGWYQFRIPLLDATRILGGSNLSAQSILQNVQFMRLWVSGFDRPVSIRIAEIDLVGNQWQERTKNDSIMKVGVVNIEDNSDYASEWGVLGIIREKDRTDPNQIIEGNEQSLALLVDGLEKDSSRQAVKYFNVRPIDLFNYKAMKMFVHGDPSLLYVSPEIHDADIFIRFGADSSNFYEYRAPIHAGWDLAENEINIVFSQLTSIKARRDSVSTTTLYRLPVTNGPPGSTYGVQGSPSLRQIREIAIGIVNVGKATGIRKSQVWVNELRLVDVDNSPGIAYRFDTQIKLADFGGVQFNYSQTDPSFHALDQRFGNQTTSINWGINANAALEKFFPQDWVGTSIPVGYSHTQNLVKPKYLPNSDVVVAEAASRAATPADADKVITESQSLHVADSYSISNFRIAPPIQVWYIRDTFSKLSLGFNYSTSRDRDPSIAERKSWLWNLHMSYGVSIPSEYYIQPFKNIFNGVFLLSEFKDWKLYYIPITNINASLGGQRSRSTELTRAAGSTVRETRNFGASKSFGFGWRLTEGGLANLSGEYGLSLDRNLLPLDNDSAGRGFSTLLKNLFFGGTDGRYGQRLTINSKPKIPNILDIPKYFDLNAGYGVNYSWQNSFQRGDIGKSAGWDNNISLGLSVRLKSLTDPWFETTDELPQASPPPEQRRNRDREQDEGKSDSTKQKEPEKKPVETGPSKNLFTQFKKVAKLFIKIPFLDYETINISFTQGNRTGNGGVVGSTGFQNFWGRLPFQGSLLQNGPSRLYQLGLISDPSGRLRYSPSSSFPFVGWRTEPGLRAPFGQFTDQYSQSNNIALRTNRPLWPGASMEINWKVGWQFSKSTTITTDSLGNPTAGDPTTTGSIERSFLTLPPVLFLKVFKSNLEDVGKKFDAHPLKNTAPNVALADAFERGMEALPFLNKLFGQYVPRPNWSLRWDGIEKVAGMNSFLEKMSLEQTYSSSFRRDFRGFPGREEQTDVERITYGFSPLASINVSFKEVLKGSLSGTIRYNTTTTLDLNLASTPPNIVEGLAQEMSLSLTYSRHGFSFPLFGLNLSNDVDVSFTFSRTKNARKRYDPQTLTSAQEGIPLEGNTRTLLEPRIRYVLSSRVSASVFYRYSKTAPDDGGSLIFGTTMNEAGLDIHITI